MVRLQWVRHAKRTGSRGKEAKRFDIILYLPFVGLKLLLLAQAQQVVALS